MNGNSLLADTNILIYFFNGNEDITNYLDDKDIFISVITEIELLSFPGLQDSQKEKITNALSQINIVDLNVAVKQETIRLRAKLKLKLPDSIVLATASYLGIPLLTADKQLAKAEEETDVIIYNI